MSESTFVILLGGCVFPSILNVIWLYCMSRLWVSLKYSKDVKRHLNAVYTRSRWADGQMGDVPPSTPLLMLAALVVGRPVRAFLPLAVLWVTC